MTPSSDPPLLTELVDLAASQKLGGDLYIQDSNLVFTQDRTGRYLSFCWSHADVYGLQAEEIIGQRIDELTYKGIVPFAIEPYMSRIHQVLDDQIGDRFNYPFQCNDQCVVFELGISPILVPRGCADSVVVIARPLYPCSKPQAQEIIKTLTAPLHSSNTSQHQTSLTQVAWNIRRTLNLETIWQRTVEGLGEALQVSRCLICQYSPDNPYVQVVAEYCQPTFESMLGLELDLEKEIYLKQSLTLLEPVTITVTSDNSEQSQYALLVVPTSYKDQPNGVIILHQFDRSRGWNQIEIGLIQELADQVGTGVAHATLFAESQNLATELQRANDSLMQQHKELEEARRQAEEASRLKSEFLANTSHELRTPLNGMIGFLKLIMDGMADDPVEQGEFIQEAYRSAVHLLSIINDILDIAKIEAGKMQLELDPVKLDDLLSDVENFTSTLAQQKNLSFEILTPATRDEVVLCGNYQRLLQVMLNLVGNAIKFTHEGGITISAEVIPKKVMVQNQELPGLVKISVADTGIGVSLEKQDKLFQSFSQVDGSRTRQYGGTGLGLAISQKLVEAMGGIVNFYSMGEGLGSTVTFTVPLYQDPVMVAVEPDDLSDLLV
jgi:signal transduction histidine kinase